MNINSEFGSFYEVFTHHNTVISVDSAMLSFTHCKEPNAEDRVTLFVPDANPGIGFIIGASIAPISIGRNHPNRSIQIIYIEPCEQNEFYNLRDPFSGLLLAAIPSENPVVRPHSTNRSSWETFSLSQLANNAEYENAASTIISGLNNISCATGFLEFLISLIELNSRYISPMFLLGLLIMPKDTLKEFCLRVIAGNDWALLLGGNINHSKLLSELSPDCSGPTAQVLDFLDPSPWFAETWRQLAVWAYKRPYQSRIRVDSVYDFMGKHLDNQLFVYTSPGHLFLRKARRMLSARKKLAVLATARDEGLYLLEWIAHHQLFGVERIFLYSNNNTDGSDALLNVLQKNDIITWIDNTSDEIGAINMQWKAYGHALTCLPDILDYQWTLILDLDEFICLHPYWKNNLLALLNVREAQGASVVSFRWNVYFTDRQLYWSPEPCAERYKLSDPNPLVKSAIITNQFSFSLAHHPLPQLDEPNTWLTVDGLIQYGAGAHNSIAWINGSSDNGQIAHFAVKSLEEYVWKYARGENDGQELIIDKRFRYNNLDVVTNYTKFYYTPFGRPDSRLEGILPALKERISSLMAIPGVEECYNIIKENYQNQILNLVQDSKTIVRNDEELSDDQKDLWGELVNEWSRGKI